MKKILLGTSALIAAVALSTSAQAAGTTIVGNPNGAGSIEIDGSYGFYTGISSNSSIFSRESNVDAKSGGNFAFAYTNTLANGLTVKVATQLDTSGDHGSTYDSNSASIGSATAGTVAYSQDHSFSSKVNHNAGSVFQGQAGFNDGDTIKWVADPTGIIAKDTVATTYINDNSANTIGYQTPSFSGASVFVGYIPQISRGDGGGANTSFDKSATLDQLQAGVVYDNTVGGAKLGFDAQYATNTHKITRSATDPLYSASSLQQYAVGASVGASGFTVAGGLNSSKWDNINSTVGTGKATVYDVGVGYTAGPASVGVDYLHVGLTGTGSGNLAIASVAYGASNAAGFNGGSQTAALLSSSPKDDLFQVSGAYVIGTGVTGTAELDYLKSNGGTTATTNTGYVAAVGLSLSF